MPGHCQSQLISLASFCNGWYSKVFLENKVPEAGLEQILEMKIYFRSTIERFGQRMTYKGELSIFPVSENNIFSHSINIIKFKSN